MRLKRLNLNSPIQSVVLSCYDNRVDTPLCVFRIQRLFLNGSIVPKAQTSKNQMKIMNIQLFLNTFCCSTILSCSL
jgi:hypothetical protein